MSHLDLVSVVVPLYNHEQYIEKTVNSVLSQTYENFELIIINDGSTDNSGYLIRKYNDPRIRYYEQSNQGAHNTLNKGIGLAQGEFISILNSDDFYSACRLEKCLDEFKKDKDLNIVFTDVNIIDEDESLVHVKRGSKDNWSFHSVSQTFKNEKDFLLDLLAGNYLVSTSNIFCRKNIFDQIGLFRNYRYCHDYDMFLKMGHAFRQNIKIIGESLLTYRLHRSNTIKEHPARSVFENNLVLARYLNSTNLEYLLKKDEISQEDCEKFFHSIQTLGAERVLLALLFGGRNWQEEKYEAIANNTLDPFHRSSISYIENK